jgi:hypothetical protein
MTSGTVGERDRGTVAVTDLFEPNDYCCRSLWV